MSPAPTPESPAVIDTTPEVEGSTPVAIITLRIIAALAKAQRGLGVTEIAQALGMPKARVHRHLAALRDHGYLTQDPRTNQYRVGWQLFLLGGDCVNQFDLNSLARPVMENLRDKVGQTIVLAACDKGCVTVIDVARGLAALEITLRKGTRYPLNTVAQGKVMLAFGPQEWTDDLLATPLARATPRSIVDAERLHSEIELVRRRGWAEAPEELFTGVNALAAPVFRPGGELFGTLAIVGSVHYLPTPPDPTHLAALRAAASQLSINMGYAPNAGEPAFLQDETS